MKAYPPLVRAAIFSLSTFTATLLALFIAFRIGLERPFWAMSTVYITSQPLSGAVRSKAAFRLSGTIIGALAAVVLVPLMVNMPLLLSFALASWVAGCLFVSLLDRTPRAYMFMLSGYTAAIIGFPSVMHPEAVFDTAILRAQEIGLGVVCAAMVHAVLFPRSVTAVLAARVDTILSDMRAWLGDAMSGDAPHHPTRDRKRLTADLAELHTMATHVPFDTDAARPTRTLLTGLQDRLVLLLPLASAIEDRRTGLAASGPMRADVEKLLENVRSWIEDPEAGDGSEQSARCETLLVTGMAASWSDLLTINLLARLTELIAAWQAARVLGAHLTAPGRAARPLMQALLRERATRPLHHDYGLALLSSLAALIAIFGCCVFWIVTAWPDGAGAATMVAIICCFFATQDDPVPAQRGFLIWTAASAPITALYLFAILPQVHDFGTLGLVLAPLLLGIGMLMTIPRWHARMIPLMLALAGGMALDSRFAADAAGFLNGLVAQLAAAVIAITVTRLLRSIAAATAIHRIRLAGWRDLAGLTSRSDGPSGGRRAAGWNSRMLDRAGLVAARVGDAGVVERDEAMAVLAELRMGMNLVELDRIEPNGAGGAAVPDVDRLRRSIAAHYRARIRQPDLAPPDALRTDIDDTIIAACSMPAGRRRQTVLAALTGLRRNFFPDAAAWQPRAIAA